MSNNDDPIEVPPEVYDQLEDLRQSANVNMFSGVKNGLRDAGYYEALEWVEDNTKKYVEGFMHRGFEPADDGEEADA